MKKLSVLERRDQRRNEKEGKENNEIQEKLVGEGRCIKEKKMKERTKGKQRLLAVKKRKNRGSEKNRRKMSNFQMRREMYEAIMKPDKIMAG